MKIQKRKEKKQINIILQIDFKKIPGNRDRQMKILIACSQLAIALHVAAAITRNEKRTRIKTYKMRWPNLLRSR